MLCLNTRLTKGKPGIFIYDEKKAATTVKIDARTIRTELLQAKFLYSETADLKLFMNADDGYYLLYPAEDTANPPHLIIINPNGLPGDVPGDAWVQISADGASGRSAEQVADEQIAQAGAGFNITRDEILIDGKQAIVVDGLPGPDSWRELQTVRQLSATTF